MAYRHLQFRPTRGIAVFSPNRRTVRDITSAVLSSFDFGPSEGDKTALYFANLAELSEGPHPGGVDKDPFG